MLSAYVCLYACVCICLYVSLYAECVCMLVCWVCMLVCWVCIYAGVGWRGLCWGAFFSSWYDVLNCFHKVLILPQHPFFSTQKMSGHRGQFEDSLEVLRSAGEHRLHRPHSWWHLVGSEHGRKIGYCLARLWRMGRGFVWLQWLHVYPA